jgi:hypothetical protein
LRSSSFSLLRVTMALLTSATLETTTTPAIPAMTGVLIEASIQVSAGKGKDRLVHPLGGYQGLPLRT